MEGTGRREQVDAARRRARRAEVPCCDALPLRAVGSCWDSMAACHFCCICSLAALVSQITEVKQDIHL